MHIIKTSFDGNPNVGIYAFATDEYCLVGVNVKKSMLKQIEEALKVPVHQIGIARTSLIGAFLSGNKNCLLVPDIASESELKVLDELKIKYVVINTKLTALGNNILCNDKVAIINPDFQETAKKQIQEALGVPVKAGKIADLKIVGSLGVANTKGCLLHREAKEFEVKFVSNNMGVPSETGTVNMGVPYVSSGIVTNSNGFIVGDHSGGPEIAWIDEVLGFLG